MGDGARVRGASGAFVLALGACGDPRPSFPPVVTPALAVDGGVGASALGFDPPAAAWEVAPVTRLVLHLDQPFDNARITLVRGTLSVTQLRDLARPALTQVLAERVVPAVAWVGADPAQVTE